MAVYRDIDSDVRIGGSLLLPSGSLTVNGVNIITELGTKLSASYILTTGTGLTGGGNLTAARTLSVVFGTTAGTVAQGNHTHAFSTLTALPSTLAGYGITDASLSSHTHTFASITSKPTTLSGYGITDAAASTHTHTYASITSKPTTISGYGITDAALATHNHDSAYLGLAAKAADAGKLDGLSSTQFLRSDQSSSVTGDLTATGKLTATGLHLKAVGTSDHVYYSLYADSDAISTRSGWIGYGSTGTTTFTINNEMANGNINLSTNGTGAASVNGNAIWHAGNLLKSDFITTTTAATVAGNFTVKGRIWAGDSSAVGSLIVRDAANQNAIHLGDTAALSNVKAYISNTGAAKFNGTVQVANLLMDSSVMVRNLNAEFIGGSKETDFVRTSSVRDMQGYGVHAGLDLVQKSPTPDMTVQVRPGVAYTDSGRRFEWIANVTVPVPQASLNYDRIDIIFIYGKADGANEGQIALMQGAADRVSPLPPTELLPVNAIVLAHIYVRANIGTITDGTSGSYNAVNNGVKRMKSVRLAEGISLTLNESLYAGGDIHEKGVKLEGKYAQLATANTFGGAQTVNGNLLVNDSKVLVKAAINSAVPAMVSLWEQNTVESHGFNLQYLGSSNNFSIQSHSTESTTKERLRIGRDDNLTTLYDFVKMVRNAKTVTIPIGTTSITWAHNYGSSNYAVNLTSNSFERHVRWTSKTANTVTIEIDEVTGQETLVDCILIGY